MTARLMRWRARWAALSARDRRALSVLAIALGAFVYFIGVLMPLRDLADAAKARHASALADARELDTLFGGPRGVAEAAGAMPAPEALAADARAAGLAVAHAHADAEGRVRLELLPGRAEAFVRWLDGHRDGPWVVVEARLTPQADGLGGSLVLAPRP